MALELATPRNVWREMWTSAHSWWQVVVQVSGKKVQCRSAGHELCDASCLRECKRLKELTAWLGALTGLQTLDLRWCEGLTALPAWLGALTGLQTLDLIACHNIPSVCTQRVKMPISHTCPRDVHAGSMVCGSTSILLVSRRWRQLFSEEIRACRRPFSTRA